jgi:hypothetical protein
MTIVAGASTPTTGCGNQLRPDRRVVAIVAIVVARTACTPGPNRDRIRCALG